MKPLIDLADNVGSVAERTSGNWSASCAMPSSRPVIWSILFSLCLLAGAGPGVLLVNQPEPWFGWPRIYVWGLGWFCAVVVVLLIIDRKFWKRSAADDDG